MANSTDMSTPVTRGELREELEKMLSPLATKAELEQRLTLLATKAELEQRVAPLATKADLEIWGGALLARIESGEHRMIERIERSEHRMIERIECSEQRLLTDLARHTKAIEESMSTQISVIDEKHADLPARVSRLETTVSTRRRR